MHALLHQAIDSTTWQCISSVFVDDDEYKEKNKGRIINLFNKQVSLELREYIEALWISEIITNGILHFSYKNKNYIFHLQPGLTLQQKKQIDKIKQRVKNKTEIKEFIDVSLHAKATEKINRFLRSLQEI